MNLDRELTEALDNRAPVTRLVEIVLRATGQVAPPLNMDSVVRQWPGLEVSVEDLDGEGYLVELGGRAGQILVNKAAPRVRQRFTLAHELGHWVLSLSPELHQRLSRAEGEKWCDAFAREMLIPVNWLEDSLGDTDLSATARLARLPSQFQVSGQAMWIQCSQHELLSIVTAGERLGEYPAPSLSVAQRGSLVRATLAYRDSHGEAPPAVGGLPATFFRTSRSVAVGIVRVKSTT